MRDDDPRPVWISLSSRTGTREEPGTLTQGAPVFPGSSRSGSPWPKSECFTYITNSNFFLVLKQLNIEGARVRWSGGPTACHCHFTMSAMA